MTTLLISGWNEGFEKLKFTRLLQASLGYTLSQAKQATDMVLEHGRLELQVPDGGLEHLVSSINELGANCAAPVATR